MLEYITTTPSPCYQQHFNRNYVTVYHTPPVHTCRDAQQYLNADIPSPLSPAIIGFYEYRNIVYLHTDGTITMNGRSVAEIEDLVTTIITCVGDVYAITTEGSLYSWDGEGRFNAMLLPTAIKEVFPTLHYTTIIGVDRELYVGKGDRVMQVTTETEKVIAHQDVIYVKRSKGWSRVYFDDGESNPLLVPCSEDIEIIRGNGTTKIYFDKNGVRYTLHTHYN